MGQARHAVDPGQRRGAQAQKAEIRVCAAAVVSPRKLGNRAEHLVGIGREVARKHRGFGMPSNMWPPACSPAPAPRGCMAGLRPAAPGLRGWRAPPTARPHRPSRRQLGPSNGAPDHAAQDCLQPLVTRLVKMIGLGGGEQMRSARGANNALSKFSARPEAFEQRLERGLRSRTASGPALKAASASTRTICRSSRAK